MSNHKNISTETFLSGLMFEHDWFPKESRVPSGYAMRPDRVAHHVMSGLMQFGVNPAKIAKEKNLPLREVKGSIQKMIKAGVLKPKKLK